MRGAAAVLILLLVGLFAAQPSARRLGFFVPRGQGPGGSWASGLRARLARPGQQGAGADLYEAALTVAQLAALLRAGRSPEQMWSQAARASPPDAAEVLDAAARASAAGAPVSHAIREAAALGAARAGSARAGSVRAGSARAASATVASARVAPARVAPRAPRTGHGVHRQGLALVWGDLAACVETAEASGCPLAGVLDRLSAQLEGDADAAAARATALAGPRATARILTVLPFAGLVIGALMGVDPLRVLFATPWGLLCLVMGVALTMAGRAWSSRLVAAAGALR